MKMDIKDFETLLQEYRAAQTAENLSFKKNLDTDMLSMNTTMDEARFGNTQIKTMMRNQNHHFTEITKTLGVHSV